MSTTSSTPTSTTAPGPSWRTVDVVVASSVGVAFGVVFWAWNLLWAATSAAFTAFPPAQGVLYGVWLVPGVLAGLVVRKPGAALLAAVVAAAESALLGSQWGLVVIVYGFAQGLAPELVFAVRRQRADLPTAVVAGAAAGLAAAALDLVLYYPTWSSGWQVGYAAILAASAAVVAGLGSWLLVRGLAATGVLAPFPAGRSAR